jgi:hypothetical protein
MLKTAKAKLLAVLSALGLGAGVVVTVTSDSCTVKSVAEEAAVDAGTADQGGDVQSPDATPDSAQ